MFGRRTPVILPQRVGHDIGDDDGFPPICGRAARASFRANGHTIDGLGVGIRQARRGAVPQPGSRFVKQQDGAEDPLELGFNEKNETLEHVAEWGAHCDHLEDLRLPVAQGVRQLALGNVARDSDYAEDLVAVIAQRHFRRRYRLLHAPCDFLLVDHRLPGADDLLLVGVELLRELHRQKFEIGLSDQVRGSRHADAVGRDLIGDDEAAIDVLDPKVVGQPVDQGLQRQALVGGGARGFEFGNVLMGHDAAAAGHRLAAHLNEPAVRQLGHPDDRFAAEMVRYAKR